MDNEKSTYFQFTLKSTSISALGPALLLKEGSHRANRCIRKCHQWRFVPRRTSSDLRIKGAVSSRVALFYNWKGSIGHVYVIGCQRTFLIERKFKLITGHKQLEFVFSPRKVIRNTNTASTTISRWAISLMAFEKCLWEMPENSTCRCHETSPYSN